MACHISVIDTDQNLLKQGCHSQGKNLENDFFPGQGKVREICGWPGKFRKDLESQGKVREFENKWLWQSSKNYIFCSLGKGCTFSQGSLSPSVPFHWGLLFKERICSHMF